MGQSNIEQVTRNFYQWEQRGRGWHVFATPVELEPEFVPFFRYVPATTPNDDALKPGLIRSIGNVLKKALAPEVKTETEAEPQEVNAYTFQSHEALRCLSLSFPEGEHIKAEEIEKFLVMLSYCQMQVSFEIIATYTSIRVQFVCRESDALHVESQLKAYFPQCITHDQSDTLTNVINEKAYNYLIDFGLQEEFTRPLVMQERFDVDPLTGLFGAMEHLREDEQAVLQVLFKGTLNPWAESIVSSVTDAGGDSFFLDAPEMPKLAQAKVSSPLYAVTIRTIGQSTTPEKAYAVVERITNALIQTTRSASNALIPLTTNGYDFEEFAVDVILRQSHRIGMIVNAKELATVVHYPATIHSKKLERDVRKTKPAPRIAEGHDFWLGKNLHQGNERIPTLNATLRLKHMHVIGATGTGKSTFMQTCIVQDILLGNGVAVLDPHGDLIESILPYIPENRYDDVIIIDPSDGEFPVGFNILSAHSDIEKEILASDLVAVFRRLSTSFGDQMHSVLANAILAFVESREGGTLIDLRRFLIEKPYRDTFLKTVTDPSVVYYWQKEYPLLKSNSIGPILTRLDMFLRPKAVRNMVAQKKSLDFESILNKQKIVFIKLSQGLIGTENSYLLGTFFVSKIYQAAMARQAQSKEERKPYFLYIDEFQNFITPSMSSILSGTRKYGLGCILAHQDMIQLQKQDTELASAVVSNAGTRVCFRLGDIDAKRFADGFASFEALDLQNLGLGEAIARIERPEYDFTISTLQLNAVEKEKGEAITEAVIARSRELYGTPRKDVEERLEYLRGGEVVTEDEIVVKESKPTFQKEETVVTEKETQQQVVEVPNLDETQRAKTTKKLVERKEQSEHRYLQALIKHMAEQRGYKATTEEPIPEGQGRVDVLLERNGRRIACEIGISTTKEWETHNIEKCLSAGYEVVIAIATERKAVEIMQHEIQSKIIEPLRGRVKTLLPEELFAWLDNEIAKEASTEKRVKGYRVKVQYKTVSERKMNEKRDSISQAVLDFFNKVDK